MQRKLIAFALGLALLAPAAMAQRGGGGQRGGTQARQRIHQPGTGQQSTTAIRKRDRKRDGTGVNCLNGPCVQNQTRTQTQTQTETKTRDQVQKEKPTPPPKQ